MAPSRVLRHLPFGSSTTGLQAATYLLGIALFSISFLVFLNSSVSFVITDLIGVKKGVGDIVGTLGFVDELVALVACPIWGLVSDRAGVRNVAVAGYAVIGLALILFVQARNVYPQLLLARIFFAVGATAAATMVTAILPSLTNENDDIAADAIPKPPHNTQPRLSITPSVDSEVTITPERFRNNSVISTDDDCDGEGGDRRREKRGNPSALAGYVGLFTGCGALVALSLFLPLPARFGQKEGVTLGQAVQYSFYIVGVVSFLVAVFVYFGLQGLKGEDGKGWRMLFNSHRESGDGTERRSSVTKQAIPYWHLLKDSVRLGFNDSDVALGYLGGFVARASTVAISLFVPLFVNAFFIRNGYCQGSPNDPSPELKKECRQAYVLASILTGVAQLVGLICAPLFGYLSSSKSGRKAVNWPIIVATTFGIVGYIAFPRLSSPEYKDTDGRGGSPAVFILAALMGVSQIGAIVCSLGSLGKGVLKVDVVNVLTTPNGDQETLVEPFPSATAPPAGGDPIFDGPIPESAPLLGGNGTSSNSRATEIIPPEDRVSRVRLKGSVAGVYSWCGGAAILLLTKLGGYLFDAWDAGAPFYLMALFNAVLLVASIAIDIGHAAAARGRRNRRLSFR